MNDRQNEEIILKIQYAARNRYNTAEKLRRLSFVLSLLPLLFLIPFPDQFQKVGSTLTIVIDLAIWGMIYTSNRFVDDAAAFRNYFDCYVFGFSMPPEIESSKIKEDALKIFRKNSSAAQFQISHTGEDDPPGVKNWYTFTKKSADAEAIYQCQLENAWWTSKMFLMKGIALTICFLLILGLAIVLRVAFDIAWLTLILAFFGILTKLLDQITNIIALMVISLKINGAIQVLAVTRTKNQVRALQTLIDEQRKIPFLPSNRMHRKKAKELSALYKKSHLMQ